MSTPRWRIYVHEGQIWIEDVIRPKMYGPNAYDPADEPIFECMNPPPERVSGRPPVGSPAQRWDDHEMAPISDEATLEYADADDDPELYFSLDRCALEVTALICSLNEDTTIDNHLCGSIDNELGDNKPLFSHLTKDVR